MEFLLLIVGVALAQTLAVVSPGPSLVVVARSSVAYSRAAGLWTALGLGVGTLVWAAAAMFGLQILLTQLPALYTAMKIAGALYLFYLAFMLWRHAGAPLEIQTKSGAADRPQPWRHFSKGLFTQLANPKVAVFFGSILVSLLPPDTPIWVYLVLLPIFVFLEIAWYSAVAVAISHDRLKNGYLRFKPKIDRVTGTVLGGLGVRLVAE